MTTEGDRSPPEMRPGELGQAMTGKHRGGDAGFFKAKLERNKKVSLIGWLASVFGRTPAVLSPRPAPASWRGRVVR